MRKVLLLFIAIIFFSSCVPKKELVYFQGEPTTKDSIYKLQNEPYRLQVHDMLYIDIKSSDPQLVALFKNTESQSVQTQITPEILYFKSYSVDRNGNIRIPYIGELNVLGYTEKEVLDKIQKEFENFFKNSDDIFITVKLAGLRFTVLGEVVNPGTVVAFQNQVNIIEALAQAGDIPITGNRKNVTVFRKNLNGTNRLVVDLTRIDSFDAQNFFIQPNDIVYVEPLKQKSWGTGATGAQTLTTIISLLSLVTTTILLIQNIN
ncbi:polysaccharide biosynthesis/export family protein [Namhaeicola litoreus]